MPTLTQRRRVTDTVLSRKPVKRVAASVQEGGPADTKLMIALDSETTGIDLRHGAKAFFVTTCNEQNQQLFWPADVDPITREPKWSKKDLLEIREAVKSAGEIVGQNIGFDVAALNSIDSWFGSNWPWHKTVDTLIAGHLLASNQPHNLTDMAVHYLGINIEEYEKTLHTAVEKARRYCRSKLKDWRIAKQGLPEMPSAKPSSKESERLWHFDSWLPKTIAQHVGYPVPDEACKHQWGINDYCQHCGGHSWWLVLEEYANADSSITLALYKAQREELKRRGLWAIYQTRLKILPIARSIVDIGVTLSGKRLQELESEYERESYDSGEKCVRLAKTYGYDLTLPKSGGNKSLLNFVFKEMKLPIVRTSKKTGEPSLDKVALEEYEATLRERSKELAFIQALKDKRRRDTALAYMAGYRRFSLPIDNKAWHNVAKLQTSSPDWFRLHPSLNVTGTDTLRWSSNNPNSQNASKQSEKCRNCNAKGCAKCNFTGEKSLNLRYCFGPEPGYEWWSLDYSNLELAIPAYESGEEEMIALFEKPNDPPYFGSNHLLIFSVLHPEMWAKHGKDVKKVYASTWYQWTKNGNFAVLYGAIDREDGTGTADRAYHLPGAQSKIKARFKKMEQLNQHYIRQANKYGYVETLPDKTVDPKRGYPLMCTRTEYGRVLETVPLNYHVQGSACWIMMMAMIKTQAYLDALNRDSPPGQRPYAMILQIHDEMVLRMPKGQGKEPWLTNLPKVQYIQNLMVSCGADVGIPLRTSREYHAETWAKGVSV